MNCSSHMWDRERGQSSIHASQRRSTRKYMYTISLCKTIYFERRMSLPSTCKLNTFVMSWVEWIKKLYILKFQKLRVLQEGIYRYPDKIIYLSSFKLFSTLMLNVGHANEAGEESWIGDEVSKIYVIETLPTLSSAPQCQTFNTSRNHKLTFVAPVNNGPAVSVFFSK